jgi:hypothetical protein
MVHIASGTYTTGMASPLPYAVVDTTKMAVVDAPENQCPDAIESNPGTTVCWIQTDLHDPVVTLHDVTVSGYCMEPRPFPGDGPYPPDGMTTYDASRFDELLSTGAFGPRRMCGYTEYEIAVAGPTTNHRYVYGNDPAPERCAAREDESIGSHPTCGSEASGMYEYGAVISQWVLNDDQLTGWACGRPQGCPASGGAQLDERHADGGYKTRYIVAGGTRRMQTRQAPYTPHTYHDHGQVSGAGGCDIWGWDDGPAVCATPDDRYQRCPDDPEGPGCRELQAQEFAWSGLVDFCRGKYMTECLSRGLSAVLGKPTDVCPESDLTLGPGQGR